MSISEIDVGVSANRSRIALRISGAKFSGRRNYYVGCEMRWDVDVSVSIARLDAAAHNATVCGAPDVYSRA